MRIGFITLAILLVLTACSSPPQARPSIMPSPFITFTPSPVPTDTPSPTLESPERPCTTEDFRTPSVPPDINQPETLIGFQPGRDWLPANDWEMTIGSYNIEYDYSTQGYKNSRQHLFVLEKAICRYKENRYALTEIKDTLVISNLHENEIIIWAPTLEHCCFFQQSVVELYDFKWERFTISDCTEIHPRAIMLAKYDINDLPDKISPGTRLAVKVITGWLPDPVSNTFQEFSTTGITCIISFQGA